MIPGIEEKRLVNGVLENGWPSYATLHQASVSLQDMGDRVITTQVRIDGDVVPSFDGWELYFKGERFVLPSDNPQAMKDNSTRNSIVDLQFQSWAIQELKRYYFFEAASVSAGVAIADKYIAPVRLNVEDFMVMLNQVLDYYFGGKIMASLYLSGQGIYSQEPKAIEINYTYLWDVIGQIFEIYGVRNRIDYNSSTGVYTIKFGYPAPEISDHDFEYGYQGGLLKFERQVQDETITNILLGRGGEKNLPYRYFKKTDPENPSWAADPDAIPELKDIYFDRLRDANFRWYVRGWMHNPNRDTSGDEAWDPGHVFPTYTIASTSPYYWAYQKGLTDERFNPVEFVKDDASIDSYGERWGAADDNDEVYPTIQGRYAPTGATDIGRIDEVVAVSEIETDDIAAMAAASSVEESIRSMLVTFPRGTDASILSDIFEIPSGQTGNISRVFCGPVDGDARVHIDTAQTTLVAVNQDTLAEVPVSGIPAGRYRLKLDIVLYVPTGMTASGTFGIENIVLTTSAQDANAWKPTFDIWVKNIWNTAKGANESDAEYAARVWEGILGDRVGNEAKVVFSTGFMSVSEDYEFVIASYPVFDQSKSIITRNKNNEVITVPSEWKITLRKSDAEYEATGLYIPNNTTGGKPVASDKFFFTGIDMPFLYVSLGEEDLSANKSSQLDSLKVVNPTWVISLDKVRVNTLEDGEYGQTLAERLAAGAKLRIYDERFSGGDVLTLYAQSVTYTWNEPSENSPYIVPDIEVVLSDKVISRQSRTDLIESSVEQIKASYARIEDVERVVRSVAEPLFLKKTGEADSSDSPTQFASKVASKDFRQGGVGGQGWGFYRDNSKEYTAQQQQQAQPQTRAMRVLSAETTAEQDNKKDSVLEVDRVVVRKELQVNSLVVNQTEYRGGREIQSAAKIECTKVVQDATTGKYVCYFDQKQGSVKNLFVVGDFAYSTEFAPDNTVVKYYRRRVDAVDVDRITLSDTTKDGSGIPAAGDIIIQYGHESNAARQFVIVRDVIGGGYERMISGLSTVSSNGKEYFFAGRYAGQYYDKPRWFVGNSDGEYAEYLNGQLNIKGRLQVLGESGSYSDLGYLADALPKKGATLVQGGLVLTSMIQLGQVENNAFKVYSGINGKADETLADPTKTIAAWYGGEMLEKSTWDAMSAEDKLAHQYAKTVYRFDGSGYLAGGNIHWDENGYGGIPGITWSRPSGSQNDVITIGANVQLESLTQQGATVTELVTAVRTFPNTYVDKTSAQTVSGVKTFSNGFKVGDATFTWAPGENGNPGHLYIDTAVVTGGDQIVGSGTPGGGGGGGGRSYLHELLDVYGNPGNVKRDPSTWADPSVPEYAQSGDLLKLTNISGVGAMWTAIPQRFIVPDLSSITALIPSQASPSNQLADKAFVNSSIATATATYQGSYNLVTDLGLTISATQAQIGAALASAITGEDNNDYAFVQIPTADATPTEIARTDRYKYNGTSWVYEYTLNNSGFTAAQWSAINSNITAAKVTSYDTIAGYFTNGLLQSSHVGDLSGTYLPLSGGSMTGRINVSFTNAAPILWNNQGSGYNAFSTVANGLWLQNVNSSGEASAVDINLYVGVDKNLVYHQGNSNKSDVAWEASSLTLHGAASGVTNIDSLLYFDTTNSRVGVAKSSPGHTLDVAGAAMFHESGGQYFNFQGGENGFRIVDSGWHTSFVFRNNYTSGSEIFVDDRYTLFIQGTGGATSFGGAISVTGSIASSGDQVITSDITKKTNFVPIDLTVEAIANAPAVTFDWKDGHGHSFGSIAQYWKPLVPEAVLGKEGNYTLAYGQLGVVLGINNGKAIYKIEKHETEQDKEIRELREALGRANEKIEGLEKEVERLRMN